MEFLLPEAKGDSDDIYDNKGLNICIIIFEMLLTPTLIFISVKYRVYKNYSSMLMISVLILHSIDTLVGGFMHLDNTFANE